MPTDDEWRRLAKQYGGVHDDADDGGEASYSALLIEGRSGFNALLGGNRSVDGKYDRLGAHGFYWTASEGEPGKAWYYNFGRGSLTLYRQSPDSKQQAISVRCVRD